uniref:Uncharacterized protein n=1 Tax=Moschus moschiferus TaxID=68415 RepID=A0A8C6CVK9_MOSMO
ASHRLVGSAMKKVFGFGGKKGESPLGSSISRGRGGGHRRNFHAGYLIQDKDLGKIHKAAVVGNVAKVQQTVLLGKNGLNDRDRLNRTALRWACANGHSAAVTGLLERRRLLDLGDNENRTVLMKVAECQEEEGAALPLERAADPSVMDSCGNTALHRAVFGHNSSLAAKPLSSAIRERREQMVELLEMNKVNIHAVDKKKEQPSCLLSSMNQQMSSDFFFSKLQATLEGLQAQTAPRRHGRLPRDTARQSLSRSWVIPPQRV